MDKNSNTGSRKHDVVWLPLVSTAHLFQQRAGLERLHQFACQSSKLGTTGSKKINRLFSTVEQVVTDVPEPSVHSGCVIRTRCGQIVLTLAVFAATLAAQPAQQPEPIDFKVYREAPRLLLNERRLRLLRRERERQSLRWEQFSALMLGHARMGEPGFAGALYGIVANSVPSCREAADWSLKTADPKRPADLRQMALVADWCSTQLDAPARSAFNARLAAALAARPRDAIALRSSVFAALAAFDASPDAAEALLRYAVEDWWRRQTVPRLKAGDDPFADRAALLALVEMLHALRDNLQLDLREDAVAWFNELPPRLILAYYPAPWPAAENEYRIPAYKGSGDPDLDQSVSSRAAELALVAADPNAQPALFLQGWLMQDRFLMRSALGAPYEFLWANPYLPGLSYTYMPDLYHGAGRLFARSNWEDDATWFGLWEGEAQVFRGGQRYAVDARAGHPPLDIGPVRIVFSAGNARFQTGWWKKPDEDSKAVEQVAFVVGLEPLTLYDYEVDGEEMDDARTDRSGILELRFAPDLQTEVRLHKAQPVVH